MNVVQVSFHVDPVLADPDAFLEAHPVFGSIAAATARAGCDLTVFQAAVRAADAVREGVRYRFVPVSSLAVGPPGGYHWLRGLSGMCGEIAAAGPDVIHVHGLGAPVHLRRLIRSASAPVLVQDHASRPPARLRRRLHRWAFEGVRAAAFTDRDQAREFVEAGVLGRTTRVFEVIEGSSAFVPGDREQARSRSGVSGAPALLWVGRLDGNKDPMTVLEAVEQVVPALPGIRLSCVYSGGALENRVRRRVDGSPELRERVRMVGKVAHRDLEDFYRAADLFVLGSHVEGSGFALLEAMACGAVPVVTDIPSFRKITGEERVASLFPPGDAEALARRLLERSRPDADLRLRVRLHFDRALSFEAVGGQLLDAYRAVAKP